MSVSIPFEHREGLANLIALSEEEANRLYESLAADGPALYPSVLARRAAEKSNLNTAQLVPIIDALISLISTRDKRHLATEKIGTDIATAAASESLGGLVAGSPAVDSFRQRLIRFIGLEQPLGVTSRALDVMIQHKHPLHSSRILTDIRSIFSSDDDPQPVAAVIVHNLRLTTITDGDYLTFTAALDPQDLRTLAAVVARAVKKERTLRDVISKAGLSYIDVVQSPSDSPLSEDED